jgi:hypothetical protein
MIVGVGMLLRRRMGHALRATHFINQKKVKAISRASRRNDRRWRGSAFDCTRQ